MGLDYYGILQIPKSSSDLEIKKAYRSLALEFNKNILKDESAKEVFALIGEACDVLTDPLRRAVFDQYGEEGLKRGVPTVNGYISAYHYHGDPMRTYKDFFGTTSPYADLLDVLKNPPLLYKLANEEIGVRKKQPPIRHPLALTLHEIFFGGVKKMKIHRLVFLTDEQSSTAVREKILTIPIKPGIRPNTEIVFPQEGDQNPTQIPGTALMRAIVNRIAVLPLLAHLFGLLVILIDPRFIHSHQMTKQLSSCSKRFNLVRADVVFITEDRPHETFVREGDDLVMTVNLSLEDALLGTIVTVNTIDHRTVRVPITDVVRPDYEKVIENEGMPILDQYPDRGNLIIRFKIDFPSYLPKNSKEMLRKGFHLAKLGGGANQHEVINKLVLADKILRVDPDERLPQMNY